MGGTGALQPVLGRELGRRLRVMRETAGLTVAETAGRLGLDAADVGRFENGSVTVNPAMARSMMRAYGHGVDRDVLDLAQAALQRGWWENFHDSPLYRYLPWEDGAATIYQVARHEVPDLLQTMDYARTLLTDQVAGLREEHLVRRHVSRGLDLVDHQQSQLRHTTRTRLVVIITEAAVLRRVGRDWTMRGQWLQLRFAPDDHAVGLQILPDHVPVQPRGRNGYRLLEFGHADDPPRLYRSTITTPAGTTTPVPTLRRVTAQRQIDDARDEFARLQAASLSPVASIAYLERLLRQ